MENNIIDFRQAQEQRENFEERMQEAERLTIALTLDQPVAVKGIQYTMDDVVSHILADQEHREDLTAHLIGLLTASLDEEAVAVSRLNRMLIYGGERAGVSC